MNKKTVIIAGCSIIGLLLLLIIIVWLLSIFKTHYYSYEEVETKMVDATKAFYKSNPEILPVNDGKTVLPYSTLESNGFIKPLNKLLKDGDSCSAEVNVIKSGDDFSYIPKLNCADTYVSKQLNEQILNSNSVVTSGSGLYKDEDGTYYFKGKIKNNYVALGTSGEGKKKKDNLWQIISIDPDGNIRIRSTVAFEERTAFDDRYNVDKESNYGYNDFEMSLLKDYLLDLEKNEELLSSNDKNQIVKQNLCIGKRNLTDTSKNGSAECSVKTVDKMMFSTLLPYEYLRASLDENCKTLSDRSCANFNFLSSIDASNSWSITATNSNSYQVYGFDGEIFDAHLASTEYRIYPVINLSTYTAFKSGDGTASNPYKLTK